MMGNIYKSYIDNLKRFTPDFFSGMFSVFRNQTDQNLYDWFLKRNEWDGLRSDWYAVGNDLQVAMNKFNAQ